MITLQEQQEIFPWKDAVLNRVATIPAAPSAFSNNLAAEDTAQAESYRMLRHKLLKALAISDSYGQKKSRDPVEDESLLEMRSVLERAVRGNNPLAPDMEKLVNHYAKLLRRFNKIVSISDSYQTQLREFNLRLELMARTDPLTGMNNRGHFYELLTIELNRSRRHERVCSVLMLDLDHFKSLNDTYGHAAGDEALRSLPRVIQASGLRGSDFFGRIGGEEFAVALPETSLENATEVAERIRMNLEHTAMAHNGKEFFVTASIGVSEFKFGDTEDTLMQRADQAMYRAKKSGRNKICPCD